MLATPYQVSKEKNSNLYRFVTSSGITYSVYLDSSSEIIPDEILDRYALYLGFNCFPASQAFKRKFDKKIGATIMLIVDSVLIQNKRAIITYVCSPQDGQERARAILFKKWFGDSSLLDKIEHKQKLIDDTYCGVLYFKNHPEVERIEFAFEDFNLKNKYEVPIESFEDIDDNQDIGYIDGEEF